MNKKVKIEGFVVAIDVKDDDYISQRGRSYRGKRILSSNIINVLEDEGFYYWLAGKITINPNAKYKIWLDPINDAFGFAKKLSFMENLQYVLLG